MVEDHGKANDQLKQIAEDKGIELPQEMSQEAQQLYDELQQKSGEEFDQAYMDEMVSDHQKDVESFNSMPRAGRIRSWPVRRARPCPSWSSSSRSAEQVGEQAVAPRRASGQQPQAQRQQAMQGRAAGDRRAGRRDPGPGVIGGAEVGQRERRGGRRDQGPGDRRRPVSTRSCRSAASSASATRRSRSRSTSSSSARARAYLMSGETEAQLEQMPEYQESQYQPRD